MNDLYSRFISARSTGSLIENASDKKCGLGLVNSIKENMDSFSFEEQSVLKQLLTRPGLHTSIVSESGLFRIHYDTTGINAPRYISSISVHENALYVSMAADSTYNFEVTFLGYPPPPSDLGEGGDNLYDIYVRNSNYYGSTFPENIIDDGQQTYTSYMDIHPEFGSSFFTEGINALHVTLAHELHHAIQLGNYINRINSDLFFYEITSTAMEEFVFPHVNDYFQYMDSYFRSPETALPQTDGYSTAIWNIYLRDNFGYDIIKRQWEMMRTLRAMIAINNSLFEFESSFTNEYNNFGKWSYFTNYRNIPGEYFEDASDFPLVDPTSEISFTSPSQTLNMNIRAAAHAFITFVNPANNDSLVVIVSNGDAQSTIGGNPLNDFEYTLFADSSSGSRYLTSNYSANFSADDPAFWSVTEILNNIVVKEDNTTTQPAGSQLDYAYPSPFYYDRGYLFGNNIFIAVSADLGQTVDFNVYTSSMELIVRTTETIKYLPGNRIGVIWDVKDDFGERLATGVYIYAVNYGDELTTGKIAIFN
ncbi:MAG: hypothetical protein PVF17_04785 [Ignavibacteria bacterium]